MAKNLKFALIILVLFVGILFVSNNLQLKYKSSSEDIFSFEHNIINKLLIQNGSSAIEISKNSDSTWSISGNDTLTIKSQSIDNFFNKVLSLKKTTLISSNPNKYTKYSIDDSSGTHLAIINSDGESMGHYIFGRSKSDFSRNYVRVGHDPNVYLTNQNIIHLISTDEIYWGETIKVELPQSSLSDSLSIIN
tara:strand:- start:13 stop:588 length:576 start_codon:yes stop_codon:yes gene_type:complete